MTDDAPTDSERECGNCWHFDPISDAPEWGWCANCLEHRLPGDTCEWFEDAGTGEGRIDDTHPEDAAETEGA